MNAGMKNGRLERLGSRLPSPSLVLSVAALFVALSGVATAAGIVAYAKHAGMADNARHLGGKTAAQIAATVHGPAGPAAPAGPCGPAGPCTVAAICAAVLPPRCMALSATPACFA